MTERETETHRADVQRAAVLTGGLLLAALRVLERPGEAQRVGDIDAHRLLHVLDAEPLRRARPGRAECR